MASTQSKLSSPPPLDPFDTLLTLEDTLYTEAYTQGANDGARAGRIEGRIFGLEKGFEKFAALGELHGRSVIWGSRVLAPAQSKESKESTSTATPTSNQVQENVESKTLPSQPGSSRLVNSVTLLHSLTDPETFSTENTEEAVADFDDRFKRAGAKAKVIERILGEDEGPSAKSPEGSPGRNKGRNVVIGGEGRGKKGDDSMEDFAGSRLLR